jgi:hypothetical protein
MVMVMLNKNKYIFNSDSVVNLFWYSPVASIGNEAEELCLCMFLTLACSYPEK